ncbi:hypothetical protein BST86_06745 [Nonlabens agnitus]|uniref:Uncharacterized protein n=1 Tax=Nonlabens agnitus TaxID=870484 RepID=A0A2S9WTK8_9FLAO|nr:hypothetical protein BST86_06745 [Nonlabens agnitus]
MLFVVASTSAYAEIFTNGDLKAKVNQELIEVGCPDNSTFIFAGCGASGCYSVRYHVGLYTSPPYKPTPEQADAIAEDLNRRCASFSESPFIDEPGSI